MCRVGAALALLSSVFHPSIGSLGALWGWPAAPGVKAEQLCCERNRGEATNIGVVWEGNLVWSKT